MDGEDTKMELMWKGGERRIPNNYAGYSALSNSCVAKRLDFVLPFVKRGQKILDLGCGVGWNTKFISLYCAKIYGLDINKEAIDYARKFNDAVNVEWIVNPMHGLSMFSDSSVDLIISIASIEHIDPDEMRKLIDEAYRILKPKTLMLGTSAPFGKKIILNATAWHKCELSFTAFREIVNKKFEVKELMNFDLDTPEVRKNIKEGYFVLQSRKEK